MEGKTGSARRLLGVTQTSKGQPGFSLLVEKPYTKEEEREYWWFPRLDLFSFIILPMTDQVTGLTFLFVYSNTSFWGNLKLHQARRPKSCCRVSAKQTKHKVWSLLANPAPLVCGGKGGGQVAGAWAPGGPNVYSALYKAGLHQDKCPTWNANSTPLRNTGEEVQCYSASTNLHSWGLAFSLLLFG